MFPQLINDVNRDDRQKDFFLIQPAAAVVRPGCPRISNTWQSLNFKWKPSIWRLKQRTMTFVLGLWRSYPLPVSLLQFSFCGSTRQVCVEEHDFVDLTAPVHAKPPAKWNNDVNKPQTSWKCRWNALHQGWTNYDPPALAETPTHHLLF